MNAAFLRSMMNNPRLPSQSWYFIAATTLSILNRADEVPKVFRYAINNISRPNEEDGHAGQLKIARRMREALIKAAAIGGLPKTINALLALKEETPERLLDMPSAGPLTSRRADLLDTPASQVLRRGEVFFNENYGKVAGRIMGEMDNSGTEDLGITARLVYGHLVSNMDVLSAVETSYVLIAGLIPQDLNPQLKGHLKGALNHGATIEDVQAVRDAVINICIASGMRRVADNEHGTGGWRSEVADLK